MGGSRKKYVVPGQVVTTGPFRPVENVILDGEQIIATAAGMSEIFENEVRVVPFSGKYRPRIDDLVIGKVVSHTSSAWELDINAAYVGFLPAQDVFGRDFASHADDLTAKLAKGDLVAARVANFDRTRDPLMTIGDRDLGKIDGGSMVSIAPGKISRLIGKKGSMIQAIEEGTGTAITVGQNGRVVIDGGSPDGLLKARKAVRMIDEQSYGYDLADRVREMLR